MTSVPQVRNLAVGQADISSPKSMIEMVRELLLTGEWAEHAPVRQDLLAQMLGVSKIPVREALIRLEHEGLVYSTVNRGFFVRPMSSDEAHEVYGLRLRLEPGAVAGAAAVAGAEDHRDVKAALARLRTATRTGGDDVGALHRAFHRSLIKPLPGALTRQIVDRLHIVAERYVRKHLLGSGRVARANREHSRILEAWLRGDVEAVHTLMEAHIESTQRDLVHELTAGGEAGS